MTKLRGLIDPISRQWKGTTYFTGADGEAHPSEEYYHCGECKHYGLNDQARDNPIVFCAVKMRFRVAKNTLSCPKFEEAVGNAETME
jgi:hypothetical protein